jgi:hypothetical protein
VYNCILLFFRVCFGLNALSIMPFIVNNTFPSHRLSNFLNSYVKILRLFGSCAGKRSLRYELSLPRFPRFLRLVFSFYILTKCPVLES